MKSRKFISVEQALAKLQRYCVYQDRCHQEVRSKLLDLGIYGEDLEFIIAELISENFLNEERYACSYARGKHRIKKWGRVRIRQELRRRNISAYCMKKAMQEIEEEDYLGTLEQLLTKKAALIKEKDLFRKRAKLASYAIHKGYESQLIWDSLKKVLPK